MSPRYVFGGGRADASKVCRKARRRLAVQWAWILYRWISHIVRTPPGWRRENDQRQRAEDAMKPTSSTQATSGANEGRKGKGKRTATAASINNEPEPKRVDMHGAAAGQPPVGGTPAVANPFVAAFVNTIPVQPAASIGRGKAVPLLTGAEFDAHIRAMAAGNNESVRTSVLLNVSKAASDAHGQRHEVGASFSVDTHPTTELTQGMMDSSAMTAYVSTKNKTINEQNSVLPQNLTFERAQLESRVIKALSPPAGPAPYDSSAKRSIYPELDFNQKGKIKESTVGAIALGTYLEHVTAQRAVELERVGSALRATLMTAKWDMRTAQLNQVTDGTEKVKAGFRDSTMDAFPQLGKNSYAMPSLKLDHSGISALKSLWEDGSSTFTAATQAANIKHAHDEANRAATGVFNAKFAQAFQQASTAEIAKSGKWWAANAATIQSIREDHASGDVKRQETAKTNFDTLATGYRTRKLTRHGIDS
jgi:hypothetical protein